MARLAATSLLLLLILLTGGCARPPVRELDAARSAMARAYAAGAPRYAGQEYQAAKAALEKAEDLVADGKYEAAQKLLPFATAQARLAARQARKNRAEEELARIQKEREERRKKEEEARRRTEATTRKKTVKHKTVKPKPPTPKKVTRYRVVRGDTLPAIAARPEVYGDPFLWPLLYKANRDQLTDPRKIYPGQELSVPRDFEPGDLKAARSEAEKSPFFGRLRKD
ncbi:LysM domain-containing protein [Geothermobacter ehrlichii]|uniref:LysM domain-containing protein n=1 Tax=Geothermobacter ehrlichii TaxID=213224 RepID=A0A5D3WQ30_9BACT|nr:DUF4398 domain-containing protein [Geothermobacter ehrlichii]TYO99909.1 LysM domain-containing protein [Geothermobacter ehrlichii]